MGTKYEVPAVELANKAGAKRGKNIVIIGAIAKLFGLDPEVAKETITKKLGKRAELLQGNLDSFNAGYEYAGRLMKADRFGFTFPETARQRRPPDYERQRRDRRGRDPGGLPLLRRLPDHPGLRHHGETGDRTAGHRRRAPAG